MNKTLIPGFDGLTVKQMYYDNFPASNRRVLVIEFDTSTGTKFCIGRDALVLDIQEPHWIEDRALDIAKNEMGPAEMINR